MTEIVSKMFALSETFDLENITQFTIPEFQREFVWTDEDIIQLFLDFEEDTNNFTTKSNTLSGYLLGNIVLIQSDQNENNFIVVDGQQRLTVLTLIYRAINIRARKFKRTAIELEQSSNTDDSSSDEDLFSTMESTARSGYEILDKNTYKAESLRILHNGLNFGNVYEDILQKSSPDLTTLTTKSEKNISLVWDEINDQISQLSKDQFIEFNSYIRSKVMLIRTIAPSESKAFQLFEVLNDRGRSLEPLDLIKNMLLKRLDQDDEISKNQKSTFNKEWSSFIQNLTDSKISTSTFMKSYILMKYSKNLNKAELFSFFNKSKLKGDQENTNEGYSIHGSDILELAKDLNYKSKVYSEIEKNPQDNEFVNKNSKLAEYMYILFKLFKIKQFHPLIMLYYTSDDTSKERIVQAALRLGLTVLYSFQQTNAIEALLPQIIGSYYEGGTEQERLTNVIENINLRIDDDIQLLDTVMQTKNLKPEKSKSLLRFIELYINQNSDVRNIGRGVNHLEREHILPQNTLKLTDNDKLSLLHFEDTEEIKQYMNRIGNLSLLRKSENISISDGDFKDKLPAYKNSSFTITRAIATEIQSTVKHGATSARFKIINEYEHGFFAESATPTLWTKEEIEHRTRKIIDLMKMIAQNKLLGDY
ncbi:MULTISPECIES: DUF262 domain-containing protein [Levilactobacillus]|uniref:DUF262 domain-containing protein n=1 Tax=Levilactobacillus TaxID=2767886 RepID=UPI0019514C15|nr:DUF262 domain-containing protein [Levilactobacillus sp. 244-2]